MSSTFSQMFQKKIMDRQGEGERKVRRMWEILTANMDERFTVHFFYVNLKVFDNKTKRFLKCAEQKLMNIRAKGCQVEDPLPPSVKARGQEWGLIPLGNFEEALQLDCVLGLRRDQVGREPELSLVSLRDQSAQPVSQPSLELSTPSSHLPLDFHVETTEQKPESMKPGSPI